MKHYSILVHLLLWAVSTSLSAQNLFPTPANYQRNKGEFIITKATKTYGNQTYADKIASQTSSNLTQSNENAVANVIAFFIEPQLKLAEEGYTLQVKTDSIILKAATEAGLFHAKESLLQLSRFGNGKVKCCTINDTPRYQWRGFMLDESRHFFGKEKVKQYLDIMASLRLNVFHWHLTDDQGWRIEIKKYPELTRVGSVRGETLIGHHHTSSEYDKTPHGGYYTQKQIREIVKYAADRYVTVIPEIELPGHAVAALTSYPWLGCKGEGYEVRRRWGISKEVVCLGNDAVYDFFRDVLDEVAGLFPGEIIHIGGDEAKADNWKQCPKCQARIKALGLKSDAKHTKEERLQSYVIHEAEEFLNEKGRRMIGWDETLEGGLAPNATVMSWRGEGGGIEAAKQKHDVIMTPNTYLYFDYYQSKDTDNEPLAIGGYLPMERVYNYEPMPKALTPEEQKYIIGVQANLWSEYLPDMKQMEYMLLPRVAALCESQWCAPEKKNYEGFLKRLPQLVDIYDVYKYNYAKHVFDVNAVFTPNPKDGTLDVTLSTIDNSPIYYTLDGTEPSAASQLYTETLKLKQNCTFKAITVRPVGNSRVVTEEIAFNKASMKPVTMLQPVNKQYEFKGAPTLVDGLKGNGNYKTGRWIAFYKNDMEAVIDMQQPTEISSASISTCVEKGDWVFDARAFSVAVSEDGKNFKEIASEKYPAMKQDDKNGVFNHTLTFDPVTARYVKVTALAEHSIPAWHGGKGNPAFLFVDEISLN